MAQSTPLQFDVPDMDCESCVKSIRQAVERIDAAGIAALISLYRLASEAGHHFSVSSASPHVVELLALVGLDRILMSHNAKQPSHSDALIAQNAA